MLDGVQGNAPQVAGGGVPQLVCRVAVGGFVDRQGHQHHGQGQKVQGKLPHKFSEKTHWENLLSRGKG